MPDDPRRNNASNQTHSTLGFSPEMGTEYPGSIKMEINNSTNERWGKMTNLPNGRIPNNVCRCPTFEKVSGDFSPGERATFCAETQPHPSPVTKASPAGTRHAGCAHPCWDATEARLISVPPPQRQRVKETSHTSPRRAFCNIPDRSQSMEVEGRQNKGTQELPQPRGAQGGGTSEGHLLSPTPCPRRGRGAEGSESEGRKTSGAQTPVHPDAAAWVCSPGGSSHTNGTCS